MHNATSQNRHNTVNAEVPRDCSVVYALLKTVHRHWMQRKRLKQYPEIQPPRNLRTNTN